MILDAAIPAGALADLETELLWDACVAEFGKDAFDRWPEYLKQHRGETCPA